VQCTNNPQHLLAISNPDQQPPGFTGSGGRLGYNYEIIVPQGSPPVTVWIYNAAFGPGCCGTALGKTDDRLLIAQADPLYAASKHLAGEYMQVTYSLYSAPLEFERSADGFIASYSPHSLDYNSGNTCPNNPSTPGIPYPFDVVSAQCLNPIPDSSNQWHPFITINTAGTYRLVVETGTTGYGSHNYGLKLGDASGVPFSAASNVRIWGWNNMCVYFGAPSTTNIFDLGEIPAAYAGKTLHFSLFDPGDSSGAGANVYMEILDQTGTPVQLPAWLRTDQGGTRLQATLNGDKHYNGDWIDIPVAIPTSYNPVAGMDWWTVRYTLQGGTPTDIITISIALSGSPIHLVQLLS
jgi:hypothetical protein